jgi:hypothetical protein
LFIFTESLLARQKSRLGKYALFAYGQTVSSITLKIFAEPANVQPTSLRCADENKLTTTVMQHPVAVSLSQPAFLAWLFPDRKLLEAFKLRLDEPPFKRNDAMRELSA